MPRGQSGRRMALLSVHLTNEMIAGLDELVRRGVFPNRSEAMRVAIMTFLMNMLYPKDEKEEEDDLHVLRGR